MTLRRLDAGARLVVTPPVASAAQHSHAVGGYNGGYDSGWQHVHAIRIDNDSQASKVTRG